MEIQGTTAKGPEEEQREGEFPFYSRSSGSDRGSGLEKKEKGC